LGCVSDEHAQLHVLPDIHHRQDQQANRRAEQHRSNHVAHEMLFCTRCARTYRVHLRRIVRAAFRLRVEAHVAAPDRGAICTAASKRRRIDLKKTKEVQFRRVDSK
jgi:hypothetical protein